jgi:hypothetical protein
MISCEKARFCEPRVDLYVMITSHKNNQKYIFILFVLIQWSQDLEDRVGRAGLGALPAPDARLGVDAQEDVASRCVEALVCIGTHLSAQLGAAIVDELAVGGVHLVLGERHLVSVLQIIFF